MTGVRTGYPPPLPSPKVDRDTAPTSNSVVTVGWPSRMSPTFAVVPPMSNEMTSR